MTDSSFVKRLLAFWVILLVVAIVVKNSFLSLFALFLTGAMPFMLFVLWLSLSERGKKIRGWFEIWHLRTFLIALLFCYGTYGNKWAGDVINEIFHLDGRYFGITSAVLAVLFTPFGLFYRPEVIGGAFTVFILLVATATPFLFFYLLVWEDVKGRAKKIAALLLAVIMGGAVFGIAFNISKTFKPAVKAFAIWADFNENHMCTDHWASEAKGVVFLDNGKVLGYFPNSNDYQFQVVSCDYAEKF